MKRLFWLFPAICLLSANCAFSTISYGKDFSKIEAIENETAVELAKLAMPEIKIMVEARDCLILVTRSNAVMQSMVDRYKEIGRPVPKEDLDALEQEKKREDGKKLGGTIAYRNSKGVLTNEIFLASTNYQQWPMSYLVIAHELCHAQRTYHAYKQVTAGKMSPDEASKFLRADDEYSVTMEAITKLRLFINSEPWREALTKSMGAEKAANWLKRVNDLLDANERGITRNRPKQEPQGSCSISI